MKKLVVIGLDCAEPSLVFDLFKEHTPNLQKLIGKGGHGKLRSTDPPITVPAWTAMMTSKDPGQLGFYGFRNRANWGYDELFFANNDYVKEKRVWNYLSRKRISSFILGVPQTYPPKPLRGALASSFLAPSKEARWTHPPELSAQLDQWAGGDYMIDVRNFRTNDKDWLLDEIRRMTRARFAAFKRALQENDHQFYMMVEMGVDRIHHGFWRYHAKDHRLHDPASKYKHAIRDYYVMLDGLIGELLEVLDDETAVMVVSDHGAQSMAGAICVNEWLMQKGYLKLKTPPDSPTRMKTSMVDWANTKAWGEGGYYSRVFFNVKGREPEGIIEPEEYDAIRDELQTAFEGIVDEKGVNIGTKVLRPEHVYKKVNGFPPDLIVYFGDLTWRSAAQVGTGDIHIFENDTGPDDANHAKNGILIFAASNARIQTRDGYSIYDIAPTILDYFDLEIPADMNGSSLLEK